MTKNKTLNITLVTLVGLILILLYVLNTKQNKINKLKIEKIDYESKLEKVLETYDNYKKVSDKTLDSLNNSTSNYIIDINRLRSERDSILNVKTIITDEERLQIIKDLENESN